MRVDSNLAQTWAELYRETRADGTVGGFERATMARIYGNDGDRLKAALNLQAGQKIALIGCGFGWLVEQWTAQGLTVVGTDTSTWIQNNKAAQSAVPVLNEGALTTASRRAVLQAAGLSNNGKFDWVITEDVLPILDDTECVNLATALRNFAVNLGHWVSVKEIGATQDARLNWKTLTEWKLLLPLDTLVKRGTAEKL